MGGYVLRVSQQLENTVLELLVSNLGRFNEQEESDRQGVYHTLGIFENVIAYNPSISRTLVNKTSLLKWLLERIKGSSHDENRGYASEILAIILQDNRDNRLEFGKLGGTDVLLEVLAVGPFRCSLSLSLTHFHSAIPQEGSC